MIKIKDYILNENDISYIVGNTDDDRKLKIQWKDNTSTYIKASFEDIEWNYEQEQIVNCKRYQEHINIQKQRIKELEEKNKILKENAIHNDKVVDEAKWNENLYKSRIDKAIEYIEKLFILEDDNVTYEFKNDEIKPLLKILKGRRKWKKLN